MIVAPPVRRFFGFTRWRLMEEGWRNVPRRGPVLVLSNHVGFFDPVKLIFSSRRTIHFLTSQATMTDSGLARVMQLFGQVPKQKGAPDPKAIRQLQAWAKVGGAVGLFPEGERSWDGRQIEFLPGIERLVRLLRVPVVTARIENADLVTPRWAETKRRGNMKVTFDPPRVFDRKTKAKEIRAWIEDRLRVDPGSCWRAPVAGRQLARGLGNLLYMCPTCGEIDGLVESDDSVDCRACGAHYGIDASNMILGKSSKDALWEVAPDLDRRITELVETRLDEDDDAELVRSSEPIEAIRLGKPGEPVHSLARGTMVLSGRRLRIDDASGATAWEVPTDEISAMTIELTRRLQIFKKDSELVELRVPRESVVKFKRAFDTLLVRLKAERKARNAAQKAT